LNSLLNQMVNMKPAKNRSSAVESRLKKHRHKCTSNGEQRKKENGKKIAQGYIIKRLFSIIFHLMIYTIVGVVFPT
jgi:hypothetical protein